MLKQCQCCFCWFNSTKPARLCKFCKQEQLKAAREIATPHYADELPERDYYEGNSPDY